MDPRTLRQIYFTPALFTFLRELRTHDDRGWSDAHKRRYEDYVQGPALRFIRDFALVLGEISPHFDADPRPIGGSLVPIFPAAGGRRDQQPSKAYVTLQFFHRRGRRGRAPGYFLHLEPERILAGAGIWRPDPTALKQIRDIVAAQPERWCRIRQAEGFRERFQMGGGSLDPPPPGYDLDRPWAEDLLRRAFYGLTRFTEGDATSEDFLPRFAKTCRAATPLMAFLCDAVGLEF